MVPHCGARTWETGPEYYWFSAPVFSSWVIHTERFMAVNMCVPSDFSNLSASSQWLAVVCGGGGLFLDQGKNLCAQKTCFLTNLSNLERFMETVQALSETLKIH